jgi:DNA-directed RNA polymerase subunit RPC12/RpoP
VRRLDLQCPNGCPEGLFEALNAPLIVDRAGRYVRHRAAAATYVCVTCQSVAIDVAAASREMQRAGEAATAMLRCPVCGLAMLPPEDDPLAELLECPSCGARFGVDEAMGLLHGGGGPMDTDADELA